MITTTSALYYVRLRGDLPLEVAQAYWAGPHADIVKRLPHLAEYRQHHFSATDHGYWPATPRVGTVTPGLPHPTPGIGHQNPRHRRYHGAVLFGAASRGDVDALLAHPEVAAAIEVQDRTCSAVHAYAVERTVPVIGEPA